MTYTSRDRVTAIYDRRLHTHRWKLLVSAAHDEAGLSHLRNMAQHIANQNRLRRGFAAYQQKLIVWNTSETHVFPDVLANGDERGRIVYANGAALDWPDEPEIESSGQKGDDYDAGSLC